MQQETPKSLYPSRYCKRPDLCGLIRLKIATLALLFNSYGQITNLSRKYNISRRFIYNLKADLYTFSQAIPAGVEACPMSKILSLRMEGICSTGNISKLMKREGLPNNSVGYISGMLQKTGDILGNKVSQFPLNSLQVSFCSDEIFSRSKPVLITVDPESLAILGIELSESRKSADWQRHWLYIDNQGITPKSIIKDEGLAMINAQELIYPDTTIQTDTFHAIAHRLGLWCQRLEKRALSKIRDEYEAIRLLDNAKSKKNQRKRRKAYKLALNKTKLAIDLYDDFVFIYQELLACLRLFDNQGNLRDKIQVLGDFHTALELGTWLDYEPLNTHFKYIGNREKELFVFYDAAEQIVTQLQAKYAPKVLRKLCLAWQNHKNGIKSKNSQRAADYKKREKELLENSSKESREHIYKALNQIVQSSAAVECINSLLRPYLNSCKNQPSQQMLNLFMFYHNHRRFVRGERKGQTPFELLTGEKQSKDWLELVMNKVAEASEKGRVTR